MTIDGYYPDPLDPTILREWSRGHWTSWVKGKDGDEPFVRQADHVMKAAPAPGATPVIAAPAPAARARGAAPVFLASAWAAVSGIIGVWSISTTWQLGVPNTAAWILIGTGVLGVIVARK